MKFPKPAEDPFGDSISVVQDVTTPRSPRTDSDMDHEQRDDMLAVVRRQYPTPRSPRAEADRPRTASGRNLVAERDHHLSDCPRWTSVGDPDAPCDCNLPARVVLIEREAEAAAPRSGELEKAARAWVAEHRNGRTCTIVDCPTATALRAAVDATEVST